MYPIKLDLPEGMSFSQKKRRSILIEDAIVTYLKSVDLATVPEIATALTLSVGVVRQRVTSLQESFLVHAARAVRKDGSPSKHCAWALGEGSDLMTSVNDAKVIIVKAVQLGMKRDPLIEALYGPARTESAASPLLAA
jgi:hypothetical protein